MGALTVHHTDTSEGAWDGPAAKANLDNDGGESYYRSAFAWQDPDGDPATKAAYKFIHHEVGADGTVGAANLTACSTGIGVLNGGRGGTTIPDSDVAGVYRHLAAHLRDGDKEPPDLRGDYQPPAVSPGEEERRTVPLDIEIREDANGKPVITGYAALFNVWSNDLGGFRETIQPGAFADTLNQDVRALWQHDPSYVLGRTTNGTLALMEDDRGLAVTIRPPDTQWARDAVVSMRRGDVTQMSFGFSVEHKGQQWKPAANGMSERTLQRVSQLFDVSPVTFPAYPQTTVSVRSMVDALRVQAATTGEDDNADDQRGRDEALRLWYDFKRLEINQ